MGMIRYDDTKHTKIIEESKVLWLYLLSNVEAHDAQLLYTACCVPTRKETAAAAAALPWVGQQAWTRQREPHVYFTVRAHVTITVIYFRAHKDNDNAGATTQKSVLTSSRECSKTRFCEAFFFSSGALPLSLLYK